MSPLQLTGPEFLLLYIILLLATLAAAAVMRWACRWWARRPGGRLDAAELNALHPYEAAYLAGGEEKAITAAVAALLRAGHLHHLLSRSFCLKRGAPLAGEPERVVEPGRTPYRHAPAVASPSNSLVRQLEERIFEAAEVPAYSSELDAATAAAPISLGEGDMQRLQLCAAGPLRAIEASLRERKLLVEPARTWVVALPALLWLVPLGLGLAKLYIGLSRGRPVGFLIILLLLCIVLLRAFLGGRRQQDGVTRWRLAGSDLRQTRRGAAAVEHLEERWSGLGQLTTTLSPAEVALAAGLFGLFVAPPVVAAPVSWWSSLGSGDGGWSSGGCGGGGCGGGCGGCGG